PRACRSPSPASSKPRLNFNPRSIASRREIGYTPGTPFCATLPKNGFCALPLLITELGDELVTGGDDNVDDTGEGDDTEDVEELPIEGFVCAARIPQQISRLA